jgi:hypothetical protein
MRGLEGPSEASDVRRRHGKAVALLDARGLPDISTRSISVSLQEIAQ